MERRSALAPWVAHCAPIGNRAASSVEALYDLVDPDHQQIKPERPFFSALGEGDWVGPTPANQGVSWTEVSLRTIRLV